MRVPTIVVMLAMLAGSASAQHCGKERWKVKTMQDKDALQVSTEPTVATITELRSLAAPDDIKQYPDNRVTPTEFTRYEIKALLMGFKLEADSDYHLVLQDPKAPVTMIGEIPLSTCAAPELAQRLTIERAWLIKTFGKPRRPGRMLWLKTPQLVEVQGVGFFDFLHGQTGVAPNGIELHPILSIQTVGRVAQ